VGKFGAETSLGAADTSVRATSKSQANSRYRRIYDL